jgi:flagellar biosynthesis/type III secretory pathway chaperone
MAPELSSAELSELLRVERECCARLQPVLDAERAAAVAYDHAALLACLREREILQAEWQRAAGLRRRHQLRTGQSLATLAAADAELASAVREAARAAATVRRAQRVNEGIIRAALAQVTDLLAVIRRAQPDSRYDGRAALTADVAPIVGGRWSA